MLWTAPGDKRTICQDRSKCTACGLNLLHPPKLQLDCGVVTAIVWIAPGNNRSVDDRQGALCALNLLHTFKILQVDTGPESCHRPCLHRPRYQRIRRSELQQMHLLWSSVAWRCCTPMSRSRTDETSPPQYGLPHATTELTELPWRIATKAAPLPWICCTWCSTPGKPSPPQNGPM